MTDPWLFLASLIFLAGVLAVVASSLPAFEERAGALLGLGFLTAVAGIGLAVLVAVLGG